MSRDFPVKGLAELDRFLSALPKNMQNAAYRTALTAAAKPIKDRARQLAPKRTGKMAKAIKTGSARQNPDGTFSIFIRLEGEHSFLGFFHEYGVQPHLINVKRPKAGEAKRSLKIEESFLSGPLQHPGHAASPFMRPALDMEADNAVRAFGDRIRAYLEGKTGFAAPLDEAA